jgi:KUP system potassium uptake protein
VSGERPAAESPPTEAEKGQIPATTAEHEGPPAGRRLLRVALAALGVVFGDIGTSPLYALRECFSGRYGIGVDHANVLGVLSLILWSLLIVISVKYLGLVLRADNRGEGGILALMALARSPGARSGRLEMALVGVGLFGAALLYGDSMITPAISVLSAVEGLDVATPALGGWVVPITVAILFGLFVFQKRGTALVGAVFGPVILTWFAVIGSLGLVAVARAPQVLVAVSPAHAVSFFLRHGVQAFWVLGAVFLVVTGGEALYADIGHFGARPIRVAWFGIVLPSLVLNYFGQGALLLADAGAVRNPFYHLAPSWALYPLVLLATAATVIASQAVISGSFSLARQAVHLGYSPRLRIEHTSEEEMGQVYIGSINWLLFAAAGGLVIGFGSSSALADAYGVAVTTTMVITTLLLFVVARDIWQWRLLGAAAMAGALLCVDLAFFGANIVKVPTGGWFPLAIAGVIFTLMSTWRRGVTLIDRRTYESDEPIEEFLARLDRTGLATAQGTAVFLTGNPKGTPSALLDNIHHNQVLHERVVLLTISTRRVPRVARRERLEIEELGQGFWRLQAGYGFMQSPSMPGIFALAREQGLDLDAEQAHFFLSRRVPVATRKPGMAIWRERLFVLMSRNAQPVSSYFEIATDRVIEIGVQVEI